MDLEQVFINSHNDFFPIWGIWAAFSKTRNFWKKL